MCIASAWNREFPVCGKFDRGFEWENLACGHVERGGEITLESEPFVERCLSVVDRVVVRPPTAQGMAGGLHC
jgi:hypothetical protein